MLLSTQVLQQIVDPAKLEDVLEALVQAGAIINFKVYEKTTIIEVATHIEIMALLKEENERGQDLRTKLAPRKRKK